MTLPSYEDAIAEVKKQVFASRTSFRSGMAVLPKDRRESMYAFYGFCRAVDDIADESLSPQAAAQGLQLWRKRIADLFQGKPSDAITVALLPAVQKFNLIEQDFQEIIDGMEMDSNAIVAPDIATLDLYCDRVASAVGRVSIRIFGASGPDGVGVAYHLGRALQLTNILRDLREDAERGRLYLPRELLQKHGIAIRDPLDVLRHENLPDVCRDLAARAKDHYAEADAFMAKCSSLALRPARIMRLYYKAIFDALIKEDWRDVMHRVSLPAWKKIVLLVKGYFQ